jgi:hypothetical protein
LAIASIEAGPADADILNTYAYPDFGIYIFRRRNAFICIRCGPIGQNGIGGHAHNDQLSVEAFFNGMDMISDPGTYLYMPLPERRNDYRSVKAHFAPYIEGQEPGNLTRGLFRLGDEAKAQCAYFGRKGFLGRHYGYGYPVWLMVEMDENFVFIKHIYPSDTIESNIRCEFPTGYCAFSPGYGIIKRHRQ